LLATLCAVAVYSDVRFGRIPNRVNATGAISGFVASAVLGGRGILAESFAGAAMGLSVLLVPFVLKMVGGGDVKFVAAAGAILGWRRLLPGFLAGAALGGATAIALIISRDRSVARMKQRVLLWHAGAWRPAGALERRAGSRSDDPRIPYAIPISVGLIVVTCIRACT
jgi:prepilin peptidase CpaA